MRSKGFLWVVLCILSALSIAVGLSVGSAVASPRAAADQSYTDPSGDAGVGTDITSLTARNDASGGISIQIASASPIVANHAVAIFIDADRNQSTGKDGDEYWMFGGPLVGVAFFAWNGSSWAQTNPAGFSVGAAAANVSDFRFTQASIGGVKGFNFVAVSISIDPPTINFWDAAPDRGYYSYDLATAQPTPPPTTTTPAPAPTVVWKLQIAAPTTTPSKAVAGKSFTVKFPVKFTSGKVGDPIREEITVTKGTMVCDPTIGGKVVVHKESFKGGVARLSFVVPKTAKGKLLKVRVSITAPDPSSGSNKSATKIATFRVA